MLEERDIVTILDVMPSLQESQRVGRYENRTSLNRARIPHRIPGKLIKGVAPSSERARSVGGGEGAGGRGGLTCGGGGSRRLFAQF